MKAFPLDFRCCKYHLWRSLKLVRHPPIDVQCLSTVLLSRAFQMLHRPKSPFIKWVIMVVWTTFLFFMLQTLTSFCPMMDSGSPMGSGCLRMCCFMRCRPSYWTLDVVSIICVDHWNLSEILQLMFNVSPKSRGFQMPKRGSLFISWDLIIVWTALHSFFASDYDIFPSDNRFGEFNGQWVFEDRCLWDGTPPTRLLDIASITFVEIIETCETSPNWCSMLVHSLELSRAFQMLHRPKSPFIKWAIMVVRTPLLSFLLHTLAFCPPMIDLGSSMCSGYSRTSCFMRWRPFHSTLAVVRL